MPTRTPGKAGPSPHTCLQWALLVAIASLPPARVVAQGLPPSLAQFLEQTAGLSQGEMITLAGGTPVVKVLDLSDPREIAVLGVVRIDVPRAFYVRLAADFPASLRSPSRLRIALFADPAVMADVSTLSVPHSDVQELANCRPGSCVMKLSATAIAALRGSIDFSAPSADSLVTAYFRQRMVDQVTAYRAHGDSALIVYADRPSPSTAGQVFAGVLARSPYMYHYAPSLERYLEHYPEDRPAGIREVLFWSEDDLPGLKPTITLNHVVVYAPPELPGSTLVASKVIYADHYLDGGLDLTAVVDPSGVPGTEPPGVYLVKLQRLHFDNLPSGGVMNIRGRAIGKLRDRMTEGLRDQKTHSEQAYARAPHR